MRTVWICEYCEREFPSEQECIQHELACNPIEKHICTKCGKEESWGIREAKDYNGLDKRERWHGISLGRMGYLSDLDGCDVDFELCDSCLCQFVDTFIHKEEVLNSGSNYYPDNEDWDIE